MEQYKRYFHEGYELDEGALETIGNIVHGVKKTASNFKADGGKQFDKDHKAKTGAFKQKQKALADQSEKLHAQKRAISQKSTKSDADKKKAKELTKQIKKIEDRR